MSRYITTLHPRTTMAALFLLFASSEWLADAIVRMV